MVSAKFPEIRIQISITVEATPPPREDQVWFISFSAFPIEAERFAKFGGAEINCWIQIADEREALERAKNLVEDQGWRVETLNHCHLVFPSDYQPGSTGVEYFEQAMIDREVLVFHSWPNVAEDRGNAH